MNPAFSAPFTEIKLPTGQVVKAAVEPHSGARVFPPEHMPEVQRVEQQKREQLREECATISRRLDKFPKL